MSEDDNRSYENLLLLCIPHASEIDDTPDHYPPELLRSWKQAELDNYLQRSRNWRLSDVQVAEVAAASFDPQPLLDQIAATLPHSARMRSREETLAYAVARARAKRSVGSADHGSAGLSAGLDVRCLPGTGVPPRRRASRPGPFTSLWDGARCQRGRQGVHVSIHGTVPPVGQ